MLAVCASATLALIAGCAQPQDDRPPEPETAEPSPTYESLEGTQWEGALDGNSLQLEFEEDGTVLVLSYNGLGPFDSETDVWQQEGETLTVTLTGLFVDGEEQVTLDVTVSGEVDSAALVLEGEYSSGAEAVMELTPLAVS
ncbi:MAG TPA: hypothetical protein H9830_03980 [Candidatus Agrococcus pullicola]|uniref:Uncharacterized protein n=1 Tax=Candidatus Agrococcus pullicola TaxID=2838429 RepID=A0A9D2C8N2_9MICO|nr:hypothetical protein [Candidatus Agrococcus pullicola]